MAGIVARFKLGNTTVKGVFRHKWDSPGDLSTVHEYKVKKLGIFFRKDMCLRIGNGKQKYSLYPSFMLGLNLIWAKCWIEINHNIHHSEV